MPKPSYEFANFRIDGELCALLQDGRTVPLTPKAFDTLLLLVENRGRLLEKELMMQRLWPDAVVEEANLANNISLLRKILGDRADAIQTVPRRGYRFVGDVRVIGAAPPDVAPPPPAVHAYAIAAFIAVVIAWIIGLFLGVRLSKHDPPLFGQLTFRRGLLWGARVAPDGETVVFSGEYDGRAPELFIVRADHREPRPLGVDACLLAISKSGDLAVSLKSKLIGFVRVGTLARLPITGGAPREIADNVQEADWAPDGSLAVIRWDFPIIRVEYPLGRVLYKAPQPIWVSNLRVSPDGTRIAFLLHESERFDDRGRAVVMDRSGKIVSSTRDFPSANGLAWPNANELWISATPDDLNNGIFSVDARGRDHPLTRVAGRLTLYDVTPSGVALAAREDSRSGIVVTSPNDMRERDLSWLDGSWLRDISDDGRTILFDEESTGGGATAHTYIRPNDGGPAVNLAEGHAIALSHDGSRVLIRQRFTNPPRLMIVPTGAGQSTVLRTGAIEAAERASWLPDGNGIVFAGNEKGHKRRMYLIDLRTNAIRPITPEGAVLGIVTPDGAFVAAKKPGEGYLLYPIAGGAPRAIPGVAPQDYAERFSSDGKSVYVERAPEIDRVDWATAHRERIATFGEKRPASCLYTSPTTVAANGRAYGYTYVSSESDLYVISGLR